MKSDVGKVGAISPRPFLFARWAGRQAFHLTTSVSLPTTLAASPGFKLGRPGRKSTFLQRAGWIRLDDTLDPYSLSRSRKSATGTGIGALSVGTGTLDVSGVRRDGEVEIGWREQGSPVVEPPASSDGLWQISPSGSLAV